MTMSERLRESEREGGYSGLLLPLTAYTGLVLPFFLPSSISTMIKPLGVLLSLFYIVRSKRIVFSVNQFFLLVYAFVVFIAMIRARDGAGFSSSISNIIYIAYAFCYLAVEHKKNSVERLLMYCYYAGVTFAIVAAISNPLWGTGIMDRTYLRMANRLMNSNQVAYIVVIGLSTLPYLLLDEQGLKRHWFFYLPAVVVMIYVLLLTMSRGPFLSFIVTLVVLFHDVMKKYAKRSFVYIVFVLTVCGVVFLLVDEYMPEDQMARLLSKESYQDASGRLDMFDEAVAVVHNTVFGEGAGAWRAAGYKGKIHNLLIDVYVEMGVVGVAALGLVLSTLFLRIRRAALLSIVAPMIVSSMVESGDDYIFWIPYILSMLLIQEDWRKSWHNAQFVFGKVKRI